MADRSDTALSFVGVSRRFARSRTALRDVTWTPSPGRTVLLGPNGAGKTTLLRLAARAIRPTRGTVVLRSNAGERTVGYMPQSVQMIRGLTVREQVAYAGWLQGQARPDAWARAKTQLGLVGLLDEADRPSRVLSGGQQRRVGLAEALSGEPSVLLLDEPTVGLDPAERGRFRRTLDRVTAEVVIVSTHQVDDLADQYDTVVLINRGQLLLETSVDAFLSLGRGSTSLEVAETAYEAALQGQVP